MEDENYRSELPRLLSIFRRRLRRVTRSKLFPEDSDDSDTSTITIGYRVPYQYIARNTSLPPDSEDGETTDTA